MPENAKYAFLSPIFDSISKKGYQSGFSKEELIMHRDNGSIHQGVVALGGVSEDNLDEVAEMGFGGVAMLGDFWKQWSITHNDDALVAKYRKLQYRCNQYKRKHIARLHYISNPSIIEVDALAQASEEMLRAGVPLIQIRSKRMSEQEIVATARKVLAVTHRLNKTLIVNDNPYIAQRVGADGVHLGKSDMPVKEARQLLGDNFIIGGTANTFEDVVALNLAGADYIGLGPFRFTTTKDNLSPVIGLEGYRQIIEQCRKLGYLTPIIAIGGITEEDIEALMKTGIYGIAMSGGLQADSPQACQQRIDNILKKIKQYER